MVPIKLETLFKIAAYTGVAGVFSAGSYQMLITSKVKNSEFFNEAMGILNKHKAADSFLGQPINSGYIDPFYSNNYTDDNVARLYVPLKGSKTKGLMYFSAEKVMDKWEIKRIELELKDRHGGKILIFDDSDSRNKV